MAGNIIPAIASTNAIVAGLIVLEAVKILQDPQRIATNCRNVFISRVAPGRTHLLCSAAPAPPNPKCVVCSPRAEVVVIIK